MSQNAEVYDLGDVDQSLRRGQPRREGAGRTTTTMPPMPMMPSRVMDSGLVRLAAMGVRSLSLFVPGASQLALGRRSLGLCFLSLMAFSGALAWAVLATLDRLAGTLGLLGQSNAFVFWMLAVAFVLAAGVHLTAVWNAGRLDRPTDPVPGHPVIPAVASALLPGWGQLLNADRVRALLFLAGGWLAAGAWVATSQPVTELINAYLPGVGSWEQTLRAPALIWTAKWTLPVVVWTLAVYDAACSALARR